MDIILIILLALALVVVIWFWVLHGKLNTVLQKLEALWQRIK